MENIANYIIYVAGFIGAITTIVVAVKKVVFAAVKPILQKIEDVDTAQCRNFLVNYFADIENGVDIKEYQERRAHECYEHYTTTLRKNSYIHAKWDELKRRGDIR